MASLTVVTGWSKKGYEDYGRRFLRTYAKHMRKGTVLEVYDDDRQAGIKELADFLLRHEYNPEVHGKSPHFSWKDKEVAQGYSFRTDAYKFCRQVYSIWDGARRATTEYVAWFDGDVRWHAECDPVRDIIGLLPSDKDLAFLGREPWHSEIGFQLYRVPEAMAMLYDFANYYTTDEFMTLHEWHSAFVFDKARRQSGIAAHNLTPEPGHHHVWMRSPLSRWSAHLKGNLKYVKSPEPA